MKRLLIVTLMVLFYTGVCFGASSIFQVTDDDMYWNTGEGLNRVVSRMITMTFAAEASTGALADIVITEDTWTDGGIEGTLVHGSIEGWRLEKIYIDGNHAGGEPTEDSDIYIYMLGKDQLNGRGIDQVDNSTERALYFSTAGQPRRQDIVGAVTISVVLSLPKAWVATGTLYLILVP
jgi:hypothetical protein